MKIVIVTGMSGAGKSTALNVLEDMGFYTIDNLPPVLIMNFVDLGSKTENLVENLAVGVDIRGRGFLRELTTSVAELKKSGYDISMLFFDASNEVLIKRYKELRRPHPKAPKGNILDGIKEERKVLGEIKKASDYVLDTSQTKAQELKEMVESIFRVDNDKDKLIISIVSFGFKHGILLDGDLIFDVRFLPNPFYVEEIKEKSGREKEIKDFVFSYQVTHEFLSKLEDMLDYTIPFYVQEGKRNLVVGIGCTGGKHRSVAIAEELSKRLKKNYELVFVSHREEKSW